jgi:hypothetical protein
MNLDHNTTIRHPKVYHRKVISNVHLIKYFRWHVLPLFLLISCSGFSQTQSLQSMIENIERYINIHSTK